MGFSTNPVLDPKNPRWLRSAILKIDMMSFFSAECGPIWIKFRRLVRNDMPTVVIWSKSKPDVEFQYGGRLGELHGMSSQSYLPHCRVLPLGEFTLVIVPHFIYYAVFYAVWALPSGGFRIVSSYTCLMRHYNCLWTLKG